MTDNDKLRVDSSAVQAHLTIMQGVITRMAENSRSCKVWCVTLVAAVLVLVARTGEPQHALIALAPAVLFYVLDAYYVALERGFRKSYEAFVRKLHKGGLEPSDIYKVKPTDSTWRGVLRALIRSFAVGPFYITVVVTVLLAWRLIM